MSPSKRATFATKLGIIAATAGSAVGLGNIWRFPSQTAQDGGAVFVLIYLACVAFFGIPIVLAEFLLGRAGKANTAGIFRNLAPGKKFHIFGYFSVILALFIIGFYIVVAGWTLEYLWLALSGNLSAETDFAATFGSLVNDGQTQIVCLIVFALVNALIVAGGIRKGIELASKLMMPLLGIVMVILCIRAVTLPGAGEGLVYLFAPNFENVKNTGAQIFMDALGQSFFSLSVGTGCLMTYASYFKRDVNLAKTAGTMAALDTGIAILAGVIIFPAAFALSVDPSSTVEALKTGGPGLVFITIPQLLQSLPFAQFWSILFFLLLVLASLTSTISMLEIITAFIHEEVRIKLPKPLQVFGVRDADNDVGDHLPALKKDQFRISRPVAAIGITIGVIALGSVCALSLEENSSIALFGMSAFDLLDYISAKLMMPLGGIFISLFAGWYLDKKILAAELSNNGKLSMGFFKAYSFILRYIVPVGIMIVLVYGFC